MWPWKRKIKSHLIDQKYRLVEAFELKGKKYFMFDNAFDLPTGRGMAALAFHEELNMRCNKEYLEKHTRAMEILLSDPKKINVQAIAILNKNLRERVHLVPFPDYIYKMASVTFLDETESPYTYDFKYNQKKMEGWKDAVPMLDFFLMIPLRSLMPSLNLPERNLETYFQVSEEIEKMHQSDLQEALSSVQ